MSLGIILHMDNSTAVESLLNEMDLGEVTLKNEPQFENLVSHMNEEESYYFIFSDKLDGTIYQELKEQHPNLYILFFSDLTLQNVIEDHQLIFMHSDAVLNSKYTELNQHIISKLICQTMGNSLSNLNLFEEDKKITTFSLPETNLKDKVICSLEDELADEGVKSFQQRHLIDIFVELIDNAIYDAAVDENGNKKYYYVDRKENIVFDENEQIKIKWQITDRYVTLSVTDCFGRLMKNDLFRILRKCFTEPDRMVRLSVGGGGIGFAKILNCVNDLIVNIKEKEYTEVICVSDRKINKKILRQNPRVLFYNKITGGPSCE